MTTAFVNSETGGDHRFCASMHGLAHAWHAPPQEAAKNKALVNQTKLASLAMSSLVGPLDILKTKLQDASSVKDEYTKASAPLLVKKVEKMLSEAGEVVKGGDISFVAKDIGEAKKDLEAMCRTMLHACMIE